MKTLLPIIIFVLLAGNLPVFAQSTPKDGVKTLLNWMKAGDIPDETECYEGEGYDITKIDYRCFERYLDKIEKTKVFSKVYLVLLRNEVIEKNKQIEKQKYATGLEADRYTLSQDPPTAAELLAGLPTAAVTINRNKATVILKITKPYKYSLKYLLDLEDNAWRISEIKPE